MKRTPLKGEPPHNLHKNIFLKQNVNGDGETDSSSSQEAREILMPPGMGISAGENIAERIGIMHIGHGEPMSAARLIHTLDAHESNRGIIIVSPDKQAPDQNIASLIEFTTRATQELLFELKRIQENTSTYLRSEAKSYENKYVKNFHVNYTPRTRKKSEAKKRVPQKKVNKGR